jgi:hypothetical protein
VLLDTAVACAVDLLSSVRVHTAEHVAELACTQLTLPRYGGVGYKGGLKSKIVITSSIFFSLEPDFLAQIVENRVAYLPNLVLGPGDNFSKNVMMKTKPDVAHIFFEIIDCG